MPKARKARRKPKHRKTKAEKMMEEQTLLSKERTILSKERTILSFIQTGLAFIGAGIVIINVFAQNFESVIVGTALVILGFIEVIGSYKRLNRYKSKMDSIKKMLGKESI